MAVGSLKIAIELNRSVQGSGAGNKSI